MAYLESGSKIVLAWGSVDVNKNFKSHKPVK